MRRRRVSRLDSRRDERPRAAEDRVGQRHDARPRRCAAATERACGSHPDRHDVRSEDRRPRTPDGPADVAAGPPGAARGSGLAGAPLDDAFGMGRRGDVAIRSTERRMEHEQDASARRQRLVAVVAVAALAATMALAFGRVFEGTRPTLQLILAAVGSVAVAGLCERRGLVVALVVSATGLAFALTWLVYPQTAWYGLPSDSTFRAIGRSLEFVAQQARLRVAPSPPLAPLMLAAVTSTWTAAFSTHALAIRAGSPLLAVLPSVALVGFADTVLDDGARPVYAITFLLAALGVVFVDGLRRVRQWGPMWFSFRGRRLSSFASRGARQVATLAVLAAVPVPWLLPGFGSAAPGGFSTAGGDGIRLDPFVSIQAQLEGSE